MSANDAVFEDVSPAFQVSWLDAVQDQFGSTPWWLFSIFVHTTILLIAMLYVVSRGDADPPALTTRFVEHRDVVEKQLENLTYQEKVEDVYTQLVTEEDPIDDHVETEDNMELDMSHGDADAVSHVPLGSPGVVPLIGIAGDGGGLPGLRDAGGRKKALIRYKSTEVEPHIVAALNWLARNQEPDGRWDGEKHEGEDTDAGITGLALLTFLGTGHTERHSPRYRATVAKAIDWIISSQGADGCIGRSSTRGGLGYHHAICGLALAEAYAMARVARTGQAAQKAVDYSINVHQAPYSAWRYNPRQEPDTSVTGWFVMQLKSAKVAGLNVPGEGFQGAINFLNKVTDKENYAGRTGYQSREQASRTLTAVGMVSWLFMGWHPDDPMLRGAAEYLLEDLPAWGAGNERVNFYYWYYGSLAMFQMEGPYWNKWNAAMKKALLPTQRKGGDEDGSWDPVGHWSGRGGRVYSTAMAAMCLEVYFRYPAMLRR
ncbi:MAG TPA: hypothetical protein ENN09_00730 [Planctomycetes bacterium]|nr:hypothetical protein [Planctomycetota bacterium]